jgi:hypothetical protein
MAEKNSLWKNIRNKAKQNRASGATPKKPTTEMLRQERKIRAQKAGGGPVKENPLYKSNEDYAYNQWVQSMPENLRQESPGYNMRGAWEGGLEPEMFYRDEQGTFRTAHEPHPFNPTYEPHLGSRNPNTGEILKSPEHHTYDMAIEGDIRAGYTPRVDARTGTMYSTNSSDPTTAGPFKEYATGSFVGEDDELEKKLADLRKQAAKPANKVPTAQENFINATKNIPNYSMDPNYQAPAVGTNYTTKEEMSARPYPASGKIDIDPGAELLPFAVFEAMSIPGLVKNYKYNMNLYKNAPTIGNFNMAHPRNLKRAKDALNKAAIITASETVPELINAAGGYTINNNKSMKNNNQSWKEYLKYAQGGHTNPYNQYQDDQYLQYEVGGKVWKNIAAGLYGAGEGILDTVTMGATDELTDKGFEALSKAGNKNIDLNNPDDVKFLKSQQKVKGYSNAAGAIGTAAVTGNVQGAIKQGTKGLNTAFQATDGMSDDFKKWSQGVTGVAGVASGFAGGMNSDSFNAAAKAGTGVAGFGQKVGKYSPLIGQASGFIGGNDQPLWQQGQAQQDTLNSPDYIAAQREKNASYTNQGLMYGQGGNMSNNSLNLRDTMGYNRFAQGGAFNQYGINMIPESAGLHHQSAYGGVPIGPNALAEGGEIKMDNGDGRQYIVSDQVDGAETQKDFTFSKGGKYKELNRTLADGMKQDLNKYTYGSLATSDRVKGDLRRPNDSYSQSTVERIKNKWQQKTEYARQRSQQEQAIAQAEEQKRMAEEQYIAAYGGRINPKKYPGLNMTKKAKGGYVHNQMIQPMLAEGGPLYGDPASPYTYAMGGVGNSINTNQPSNQPRYTSWEDMRTKMNAAQAAKPQLTLDQQRAQDSQTMGRIGQIFDSYNHPNTPNLVSSPRPINFQVPTGYAQGGMYGDPYARGGQIDYTNDMYSMYAGGGPMPSDLPQAFNGPAAQNSNGMYLYPEGGPGVIPTGNPIYTPDSGIEQFAPDASWLDGGNQVAAPGNVVSWPSYPETYGDMEDPEGVSLNMPTNDPRNRNRRGFDFDFDFNLRDLGRKWKHRGRGHSSGKPQSRKWGDTICTVHPDGGSIYYDLGGILPPTGTPPPTTEFNFEQNPNYLVTQKGPILASSDTTATPQPPKAAYIQRPYMKGHSSKYYNLYSTDPEERKKALLANKANNAMIDIEKGKSTGPQNLLSTFTKADGGMMPSEQQMQQEQQGGQDQMMQMVQQVAQAIGGGANPEQVMQQVMQQLVQAGAPEEQAMQQAQQIVQAAMQEVQGQQQQQPMQEGQQMPPQQGMARGGYFNGKRQYYTGGTGGTDGPVRPLTMQEAVDAGEYSLYPKVTSRTGEFEDQFYNTSTGPTGSTFAFANNQPAIQEEQAPMSLKPNVVNNQSNREELLNVLPTKKRAEDKLKEDKKKEDKKDNKTNTTTTQQQTPKGSKMSATDLAFMAAQLAGPAYQFFQKKPEAFQYKKGEAKTLDSSTAIMLADQALKESEAGAGYAIRQAAPTAGSYLANIRANALDFGKKRGASSAGIRGQYDLQNTGILNQFEQYNTELENKAIDAMQQDQANYQEQRTNALYNAGANLAGMRKDYNAGEIDKLIANNIGTSNYKYDQAKQTITYKKPDGKEVTIPVSTVLGGNTTT